MRPEPNVQTVLMPFYHRLKTAAALSSVLPGRLFSGGKSRHQSYKQPGGVACDTLSSTIAQVIRMRWKMVSTPASFVLVLCDAIISIICSHAATDNYS